MKITVVFALLFLPASVAQSAIVLSGNPQTGSPAFSIQITAPIVLTATTTANLIALVMDDWVAADGDATNLSFTAGTVLSYKLNNNSTATIPLANGIRDNVITNVGSVTIGDGAILFAASPISLTAGDTLTILPQTLNVGTFNAAFNPNVPTVFTGSVFGYTTAGIKITNNVVIPEPSSSILVGACGVLGAFRRRRA